MLNLAQLPPKTFKREDEPITFTKEDGRRVHFLHNDLLTVNVQIGNIKVHKTLVHNRSSVDFLYFNALQKMGLDGRNLYRTTTLS